MMKNYHGALCAALLAITIPIVSPQASAAPIAREIPADAVVYPDDAHQGDLTVEWDVAKRNFKISYIVPSTGYYYDDDSNPVHIDLENVTKVVFSRDLGYGKTEIATIDNPAPGNTVSITDADVLSGSTYDYSAVCYVGEKYNSTLSVYSVTAGSLPAPVSDVTVATTQGKAPVTVSFTVPSTYSDGKTPISAITRVTAIETEYDWIEGDIEHQRGSVENPAPGSRQQIVYSGTDLSENTSHTWILTAEGGDGKSEPVNVQFFLGNDRPAQVTNLNATINGEGNVVLTWDAPDKGCQNGYINPADTRYKISTKPTPTSWDETEVATDIAETTYTYVPEGDAQQSLVFCVKAYNSVGESATETTPSLVVGPAEALPYTEGFDGGEEYSRAPQHVWGTSTTSTSTYPTTWKFDSYAYIGSDKVTPRSGDGGFADMRYYSSASEQTHDYLTSGSINVAGQQAVQLSFCHYTAANNNTSTITAWVSFDKGEFQQVYTGSVAAAEAKWVDVTRKVTVPAGASTAVIRFEAFNGSTPETVIIDDIKLESAQPDAIVYPASVSDFTAEMNEAGNAIDIALTAPTLSHASLGEVHGEPLTRISSIKLYRNISGGEYALIHTFDNPAPGERLTYSDTDLAVGGSYYYRAVTYIDDRCDYGEYPDHEVMVGQRPADVTEFTITSTRGNAPVMAAFKAPAVDTEGKELTENVSIALSRYDYVAMTWTDLKTWDSVAPGEYCSYSDNGVTAQSNYKYQVKATGRAGESYGISLDIYVGVDQPMPPTNVNARIEGDKVVLTWDAPAGGINNGYIDFENLTYKVYKGNGYSDYNAAEIADGIRECTFTDPAEYEEEENVRYFVKAVNMNYEGYSTASQLLTVGPAATLPFTEGFDSKLNGNITADRSTWKTSSTDESTVWAFAEMAYFILEGQVVPYSGDGLAYAYYGPYASTIRNDYLTSGHIDISNAVKPVAEYYVYVVPEYETSLTFEVSTDDENYTPLHITEYTDSKFTEAGWVKVECDLSSYKEAGKISMRFNAHKDEYSCSTAIDQIRVYDKDASVSNIDTDGINISVDGRRLTVDCADGTPVAVCTLNGMTVARGNGSMAIDLAPAAYIVNAGGKTAKVMVR